MAATTPFLATKLRPPLALHNPIGRQRLVTRLDDNLPLTLITAPAGCGKTTLLTEWLGQNPPRVAWLSLDADDSDPARFWGYVLAALQQIDPTLGATAPALLQSPQLPVVAVLTDLINQVADQTRSLALVLEDYHVIDAQPIHESLIFLLDHLPAQMRLIVTTRADPPWALAGRRARGQLTEIRAADLRFTPDEAAAFLTQALGPGLSMENIAALEARTEGWIAGLQLAALALQGRRDVSTFVERFTGSHRCLIDYLVAEVLARQPEPIQTFLLQTSILERLNGSLCEAVLTAPGGVGSGQAMLERLEQANLFLPPLDDERQWYRYHSLFAEMLRHHLPRHQAALVPSLHRRASAWYEQHGLTRDAIPASDARRCISTSQTSRRS
jgi:LuxR family transcriptional regulator, maltose regulon positive regulatory protein